MPIARFSPFELLLLKSRHQADTAALLLLAWVLASRGHIGEPERARLTELTSGFRHGHALEPIIEIAASQDLAAIQLAAELLQKECHGEQAYPFLRLAIALAVEGGKPSLANHHVLRFLADLLGVAPGEFAPLFEAVAGKAFANPDDPSRTGYWQAKEHHHQQQEQRRQQQERHQHSQRDQERQRRERDQQEQARQRREQERQEQHHQYQRQRRHGNDRPPPAGDRTRRALVVLGLEPGASRSEIRKAYRRLAQTHHPDRVFAQGEARVASASLRFQRIKSAYEYLMEVS
ncbi:DnaJ domain-containing protein [Franzmannia pantelleriensis]|uniref:DnaJ domain-containing protein n=1 Tax=Franzmannia pantelleriensis TaxID=48727 RepID=A0A1G9G3R3_9GAMM|nr:J domain-containing protein [Halomonas pantelleriensis]SDK95328.1 DnaJ domain-containing protein [Halomonas pantelleriensis]